jgi:voltage-gated potassium channel
VSPLTRFLTSIILILIVIAIGVFGFSRIEGWSLDESLYMTVITISTVGFGEVHQLSRAGQHFTIIFLAISIATVGFSVTTLIGFLFEGQIVNTVRERRMKRLLFKSKEHFIICGFGDIGREIVSEFQRSKERFIVVDKDPDVTDFAKEQSIPFVKGDATEEEVLIEAKIEKATGLVAALPDDQQNVFVVLTARQLNPHLTIISQASDDRTVKKLYKAGADRVISPKQIAGRRLAATILHPSIVTFLDILSRGGDETMRIESFTIPRSSPLREKSLKDTNIGQCTGAIIIGIIGPDGLTRTNPSATAVLSTVRLQERDELIALGNSEQLQKLDNFVQTGK